MEHNPLPGNPEYTSLSPRRVAWECLKAVTQELPQFRREPYVPLSRDEHPICPVVLYDKEGEHRHELEESMCYHANPMMRLFRIFEVTGDDKFAKHIASIELDLSDAYKASDVVIHDGLNPLADQRQDYAAKTMMAMVSELGLTPVSSMEVRLSPDMSLGTSSMKIGGVAAYLSPAPARNPAARYRSGSSDNPGGPVK